jgi:hypothetical protein
VDINADAEWMAALPISVLPTVSSMRPCRNAVAKLVT